MQMVQNIYFLHNSYVSYCTDSVVYFQFLSGREGVLAIITQIKTGIFCLATDSMLFYVMKKKLY